MITADRDLDEKQLRIGDLVRPGDAIGYLDDFGDSREHKLPVEQAGVAAGGVGYPACLAGEGACPREDCGGS